MSNRRPVIAFVTDAIAPFHHGGKEQRYESLLARLAQHAEVHVYTMHWWGGSKEMVREDVRYHAISPLVPMYGENRRSIRQALVFALCCVRLLVQRFDVIEADHMPYLQLVPLKLVALLRRRRLVVTWHEYWGPEYWREYLGLAGLIGAWCELLALRLPDAIVAASPETAERLDRQLAGSTPVITAPNGVDLDVIAEAPPAVESSDLIVVGRLIAHKRVDLLLRSVAHLRAQGHVLTLRVVGNGPELARLRLLVDELGLGDAVTFDADVAAREELFARLKAARAAVFPSAREGFGIAVLEALACGIPVVTTAGPDNLASELVVASGGGVVCEPGAEAVAEAILTVLEAPSDFRCDPGWLRQYDWKTISELVASVLLPSEAGAHAPA